jgi:hypothetical protein
MDIGMCKCKFNWSISRPLQTCSRKNRATMQCHRSLFPKERANSASRRDIASLLDMIGPTSKASLAPRASGCRPPTPWLAPHVTMWVGFDHQSPNACCLVNSSSVLLDVPLWIQGLWSCGTQMLTNLRGIREEDNITWTPSSSELPVFFWRVRTSEKSWTLDIIMCSCTEGSEIFFWDHGERV